MLNGLLAKINAFEKLAGVLGVPDKLLNEINDYILARYCYTLNAYLDRFASTQTGQLSTYNKLLQTSKDWSLGIELIENVVNGDESHLEALISWLGETGKDIYWFDDKSKNVSNIKRLVKLDERCLSLNIGKSDKGYDISLMLNYDNFDEFIFKQKYSFEQIKHLLDKNYVKIQVIYEKFVDFIFTLKQPNEENTQLISSLAKLRGFCRKSYSKYNESQISDGFKTLFINSRDIEYLSKYPNKIVSIDVEFVSTASKAQQIYDKEKWAGLWAPREDKKPIGLGKLYITQDVKSDFENIINKLYIEDYSAIEYYIDFIKSNVRHELQHFIQSIISYVSGAKAGLPSKKMLSKEYDEFGRRLTQDETNKETQTHALRDLEFYTRLSDDIASFNKLKTKLPVKYHKLLAKAWIDVDSGLTELKYELGLNPDTKRLLDDIRMLGKSSEGYVKSDKRYLNDFFLSLKHNNTSKYNKAAKEFISKVY